MPLANGIDINLQPADNSSLNEFYAKRACDDKTRRVRCIVAEAGTEVQVSLRIKKQYHCYGTDTLLVTVACHDRPPNVTWAIRTGPTADKSHVFLDVQLPKRYAAYRGEITADSVGLRRDHRFEPVAVEQLSAKPGCIAIVVKRGFLCKELIEKFPLALRGGDQSGLKDLATYRSPTLIHPAWFAALPGPKAEVAQIYYKNIDRLNSTRNDFPSVSLKTPLSSSLKRKRDVSSSGQQGRKTFTLRLADPRRVDPVSLKGQTTSSICLDDDEDDEELVDTRLDVKTEVPPRQTMASVEGRNFVRNTAESSTAVESSLTTGTDTTTELDSTTDISGTDASSAKARKLAQLQLSQQKLDLEKRKIELQEQQLALDQQHMELGYEQ